MSDNTTNENTEYTNLADVARAWAAAYEAKKLVTIPKEEYDTLKRDSEFLSCLEACGVDNWDGYYEAQLMMEETE